MLYIQTERKVSEVELEVLAESFLDSIVEEFNFNDINEVSKKSVLDIYSMMGIKLMDMLQEV